MLTLFWLGIKIGIMICSRREYYGISENREKYRTMPYVRRRDAGVRICDRRFFYGSGEIQIIFRAACRACRRRSRL